MSIENHLPFDNALAFIVFMLIGFMPSILFTYDKKEEKNMIGFPKQCF